MTDNTIDMHLLLHRFTIISNINVNRGNTTNNNIIIACYSDFCVGYKEADELQN